MTTPKAKLAGLALIAAVCAGLPQVAWSAAGDWPETTKMAYVERCAKSMHSQGLALVKATGYCRCSIDGQEIEFGTREYAAMMKAQPNPRGSDVDRRLFKVLRSCSSHWLPQWE